MAVEVAAEILKRWGAAVRRRREELGMTQTQLAAAAGYDQRTISGVELGRHQPSLVVALAIADALDTSYDSLFSVDEVSA